MKHTSTWLAVWLAICLLAGPVRAQETSWHFGGDAGLESRWFPSPARWAGQSDDPGASLAVNLDLRWQEDRQRASVQPFARVDSLDDERTHFDLREAYWAFAGEDWEVLLGVNKVFWGVAESRHLVDIVNQTDLVEDPDREQKLGQPMVQLLLQRDWGDLEFFLLPYFRERTFPGAEGRLRSPLPVDTGLPVYESAAGQFHGDLALRWSHYFADIDIGVSVFHGTGRTPKLLLHGEGDRLLPYYHQITQLGVDLQYTRGAWLWKAEAIFRDGLDDTFLAAVAGFEYTFFGVGASDRDVGVLVEYLYDDRGPSEPVTPFDRDIFVGARLTLNDTQGTNLLAGAVVDPASREWFLSVEAERRLAQNYFLEGRVRLFRGDRGTNQLFAVDRDDYLQLSLTRYF